MTKFLHQRNLLSTFGNPSYPNWGRDNIIYITPPFKMRAGKIPVHRIPIHRTVAPILEEILNEIWVASGKNEKKIHEWHMDSFDGSWVIRSMRGSKRPSVHSWGLAVDFGARWNPLGVKPGKTKGSFTADHPVTKIMESHNVVWGGRWKSRPDGMHFQFARI